MYGVSGTKNIVKNHDGYAIYKQIDGEVKYFGYGKTLIMALMKRDWVVANGWKPYPKKVGHIVKTPSNHFIIRRSHRRGDKLVTRSYGTYRTLGDATDEYNKLIEVDWDLDAWCDLR